MKAGLYIHIPFCTIRCGYCDFYTVPNRSAIVPSYLDALKHEIEIYAQHPEVQHLQFETVFLGGGTPSLLSPKQVAALLGHLSTNLQIGPHPEITVEANPGTVDIQKLRGFRNAGVNRLSIGMQSFRQNELTFLDRDHSAQEAVACLNMAREAGFDNISLDLIWGLSQQRLSHWEQNLQRAIALDPDHISTYNLTYEPGTPLTRQLIAGKIKNCPDNTQRNMQFATMAFLRENGYSHYEVSNYARPGFESRHNQKYWDGSPYLGVGVSAHSFLNNRRFWNIRNLDKYIKLLSAGDLPIDGEEQLDDEQKFFEAVFLNLRQRRGLDLKTFEKTFGVSFFQKYFQPLRKFFVPEIKGKWHQELTKGTRNVKSHLLEIEDGFLRLTDEGVLVCDTICAEFA